MDSVVIADLTLIFLLVLANAFFSIADVAITGADRQRLRHLGDSGDKAARCALHLALSPDPLSSMVQVGIKLVGTFAAAYGGTRIVIGLEGKLARWSAPWIADHREAIALILFVTGLSALFVVVGELIPRRLALADTVGWARLVSRPLWLLEKALKPFISAVEWITRMVLAVIGVQAESQPSVSLQEIHDLIEAGTAEGVLEPMEQKLAVEALSLGDRIVRQIMRPRIDIDAADVNTPPAEVLGVIAMAGFSRLPVYDGDLDHIVGFIHLKDVLRQTYLGWQLDLRKLARPALFVPDTMHIDQLLSLFQSRHDQLAIVVDEFGATKGMVTLEDVLGKLVGADPDAPTKMEDQSIIQRDANSWLVDGSVNIDDLLAHLNREHLGEDSPRNVTTVAGLVLSELGRIPSVGEHATWNDLKLEVVDMDGQRIDKLLVSTPPSTDA